MKPQPAWGAPLPSRLAPDPEPATPARPIPVYDAPEAEPGRPRLSWADVAGDAAAARPSRTFASGLLPVGTFGLSIAIALMFWVELVAAVSPAGPLAPGYRTLVALGGINGRLVLHDGQVWRLLTAPWLHANLGHLLGNALVLVLVGRRMERMTGTAWFLAVYLASGLAGALASVLMNPSGPVSVGASGAIMGLISCSLVLSFHAQAGDRRMRLRIMALRLLIPALLPHAGVDYRCHLGGAMAGAALGFMLQMIWPEADERPSLERPAGAAALGLGGLSVLAFLLVAGCYGGYARREAGLIPDVLLPRKPADFAQGADLSTRFPRDPRGYLYAGLAAMKAGDPAGAESDFRTALGQGDTLDNDMPPAVRPTLQAALAEVLKGEGRPEEARAAAAPVCADPAGPLYARTVKAGLCGTS